MKYCDREDNKWCGRIEFTVSRDVIPGFKKAVGEIAEEDWTTLMKRERMQDQLPLPGMEQDEKELPFQTMLKDRVRYKVFGIVANMGRAGQELIEWHYKRYGKSEQTHSVMKEDLAGGMLSSGDFGENAT